MSLRFVIIPVDASFIDAAHYISDKLETRVILPIQISIDTNYSSGIGAKSEKWNKLGYDCVIIGKDYKNTNACTVRFAEDKSNPQKMNVDDFLDLVCSYDDNDNDSEDNEHDENAISGTDTCSIM